MHIRSLFVASAALVTASLPSVSLAQTILSTDFNSGAPAQLGGSFALTGVQGYAGVGPSGNQFSGDFARNDQASDPQAPMTFTFAALPAGTTDITMSFLFAAIDSWDGISGTPGPDTFVVRANGVEVFAEVFANQSGSNSAGAPALLQPRSNLGFSNFADAAYLISLKFPVSSSSLTIELFARTGWQGGSDESWAIDNLDVAAVVPAPGAALLLGLAAIPATRRRRA